MSTRRPASRGPAPRRNTSRARSAVLEDSGPQTAVAAAGSGRRRPRLTGRAAILALVCAVLAISYASSAKAYLQQRHDTEAIEQQIVQRQASIDSLQSQVDEWKDPAYVAIQARERFGYVMPGETAYVALDANGKKIQPAAELGTPVSTTPPKAPWWDTVWGSVKLAGQ